MERREYIFIAARLLLIACSFVLFAFLVHAEMNPVRLLFSGVLSIFLIGELFFFLIRTRKRILRLLDSFVAGDPARLVDSPENNALATTLNRISEEIRKNKTAREVQHQYLKSLVDNMDIAIACVDDNWQIKMANESWFEFVGRPHMTRVDVSSVPDKRLFDMLMGLSPGKKESFQVDSHLGKRTYALQMESFMLNQEEYRLLTAKDIEAEVQVNETEAWLKLLRVLTHEIMNSIAPVSSLSETIHQQMESNSIPSQQQLEGWKIAVGAIASRSKNLLDFTHAYRQLTRLPAPVKTSFAIEPLLSSIWNLLRVKYENITLQIDLRIPEVQADPALMEQLLLNLMKNACEAIGGNHESWIRIESHLLSKQVVIRVTDNGPGIPEEILSDVFLPFFTTKQSGSGVGLSLSRQIMQAHGGSIRVGQRKEKSGASIDLLFPGKEGI